MDELKYKDGKLEVGSKIDIDGNVIETVDNTEFIEVTTDSEGKVLNGTTVDGEGIVGGVNVNQLKRDIEAIDPKSIEQEVKEAIDKAIADIGEIADVFSVIEDPEGRSEITTDAEGKIISFRDAEGVLHENVGIETNDIILADYSNLIAALKSNGMSATSVGDWSDYISVDGDKPLHIAKPKCAVVNLLTDYNLSLLSKKGYSDNLPYWPAGVEGETYDIPIVIEFWDMQGNYFKKKALLSGQGSSTMSRAKKNMAIDLFDDEWGEDAFKVKFGNWIAQDSFHLKAYDYEPFVGASMWSYTLYEQMAQTRGAENDHIWKRALLDQSGNTSTVAYGETLDNSSKYNDTGARCFPDGFPVVVYQQGVFWGVFSFQIKKHRDNYHLSKSNPKNIHLDGFIGSETLNGNGVSGNIRWDYWEIRNPKNLVYSVAHNNVWKYDADVPGQFEIAGNNDGNTNYDTWSAGTYPVGKIVEHGGHKYLNTVAGNTLEPVYDKKNNGDDAPDFKNKTGCGWLNVTNTVKVKEYILALSTIMGKIDAKEAEYKADMTAEKLQSLKAEIETYFDVDNLIDYIIINDVVRNDDAFWNNWQWLTYDGIKWWIGLYDCNISFGYGGSNDTGNRYREPIDYHLSRRQERSDFMLRYIIEYYSSELNQRWAELRGAKILDANNIFKIVKDWIEAISIDFINLECEKWMSSKCIDNMSRIEKWVDESISKLDTLYEYNQN